ncbi:hypothetical protein [Streptomyces sp. TLI_171]|uniref:hypothetical protein n=1 Tax=Streptomyces sp. TLI_171 TaxID=1938859 RepID=UPI000C19B861|nr:hypothetical protein [Streptomyces sp. TLI_171]RKE22245.1 hypothetical protein BX266_5684 [Streptomyces sp. TLI_171]
MKIAAVLVDAAVLGSVGAALLLGPRLLRVPATAPGAAPEIPSKSPSGSAAASVRARRPVPPEALLAAVTAVLYLNQLFCSAYLLRVHGGDTSFVARYLPAGWFDQPTGNPLVRALADRLPAPRLFAPTVLRVQAFLELPFVLLAYATVLRRLSPALHRTVLGSAPLAWTAALSYTVVFSTVEWALYNPWTLQDVALRVLSALLTVPLLLALARRDTGPDRHPGTLGLLHFAVTLWALGTLVMVVYDTALLYNLGHLPTRWPLALFALLLLAATARRPADPVTPGPATRALATLLRRGLVLFLIPALAVRYGLGYPHPAIALAGALLIAAATLTHRQVRTAALPLTLSCAAGLATACLALHLTADTYPETGLLRAMVTLPATAALVAHLTDRRRTG